MCQFLAILYRIRKQMHTRHLATSGRDFMGSLPFAHWPYCYSVLAENTFVRFKRRVLRLSCVHRTPWCASSAECTSRATSRRRRVPRRPRDRAPRSALRATTFNLPCCTALSSAMCAIGDTVYFVSSHIWICHHSTTVHRAHDSGNPIRQCMYVPYGPTLV